MPTIGQLIKPTTSSTVARPGMAGSDPPANLPPAQSEEDYNIGAQLASGAIKGHLPSWGDRAGVQADFLREDEARRAGGGSSYRDRANEGRLMASTLGPLAPLATVPVAAVGAGYEGVKALGQATGLGRYFPGPFKVDETTSPASVENVVALLRGYTTQGNGG